MENRGNEPSQVRALTSGSIQMKAYLRMPGTAMMAKPKALACALCIQDGALSEHVQCETWEGAGESDKE